MTTKDELALGADSVAPDAAPKPEKRARAKSAKPTPKRTPGVKPNLRDPIRDQITQLGVIVGVFNAADGQAIINGAEAQADALQHAAEQNDRVRAALQSMLQSSVWAQLFAAFMPTVLAIAMNHGFNPMALVGAPLKPSPVDDATNPAA